MFLIIILSLLCFVKVFSLHSVFKTKKNSRPRQKPPIPNVSFANFVKHVALNKFDPVLCIPILTKIYGSSFKINVFGFNSIVLLGDPKMLQKLYMSADFGHFEKAPVYKKFFAGPAENGLILSKAKIWSSHRSTISKAFTYRGLMCQVQIFEEEAKKLVFDLDNYLTSNVDKTLPRDVLNRLIYKSVFNAATKIISGRTNVLSKDELDRFFELFQKVKCLRTQLFLKPWLTIDFLWNMHPDSKKSANMMKELAELTSQVTKKARQLQTPGDGFDDESEMLGKPILELMIQSNFNDEEIFTEFVTLVNTGHETVGQSLNFLMMLLAKNKNIQDKCLDEVNSLFHGMNSGNQTEVSMESLTELKYLERCIREELRLYPTAPLIGRKLESPLVFDNNMELDIGCNVFSSSWYLHRNEDIYPDPERFDPDRFLPENFKNRGICEYMPFSVGPRNCIAWKSAVLEMKMYAAYILYNFEVYIDEGNDIKLGVMDMVKMPDLGVKFRRRH